MKLSVALCTYNGEIFLSEQLDSILNQNLPVNEIIICDDRSTDNTIKLIEKYQYQYPGVIQLFVNEQNLGPRKNFEKAISLTTGDIIFLADQDDFWHANKTETIGDAFMKDETILGVFTNGQLIDSAGTELGIDLWTSFHFAPALQILLNKNNLFEMMLRNWTIVTGSTLAIKKAAKELILPFQHMPQMWHDEWIAYCLASVNALLPVNKNVFSYRIHDTQQVGVYQLENMQERTARRERFFLNNSEGKEMFELIGFKYSRLQLAYKICNEFPKKNMVPPVLRQEFFVQKKRVLQTVPFFRRKLLLLKWMFERRYYTSFNDFLLI